MMCYLDRTFCISNNCKNKCGYKLTQEIIDFEAKDLEIYEEPEPNIYEIDNKSIFVSGVLIARECDLDNLEKVIKIARELENE